MRRMQRGCSVCVCVCCPAGQLASLQHEMDAASALVAERDALQAALADARRDVDEVPRLRARVAAAAAQADEADALAAELAELNQQVGVGVRVCVCGEGGVRRASVQRGGVVVGGCVRPTLLVVPLCDKGTAHLLGFWFVRGPSPPLLTALTPHAVPSPQTTHVSPGG